MKVGSGTAIAERRMKKCKFEFDRRIGKIKSFKRKPVRNVSDLHT
jgi:hypothetical protein